MPDCAAPHLSDGEATGAHGPAAVPAVAASRRGAAAKAAAGAAPVDVRHAAMRLVVARLLVATTRAHLPGVLVIGAIAAVPERIAA